MKLSTNIVNQYLDFDLRSTTKDELIKKIGLQLGEVEGTVDWSELYRDLYVVKIVDCFKHEQADKLNVCLIDDNNVIDSIERNDKGLIQVVCGAPNAKAGIHVVWIPPKAIVPSSRHQVDPFVIESRKIRDVMSHGMLASPSELGISDNHDGILELTDVIPGQSFAAYFDLDDYVIDCENKMFTHRPDCFGNIGLAREISGIFGYSFKSPDWYLKTVENNIKGQLPLNSMNSIEKLVPRFMLQIVEDIKVQESSIQIQSALTRLGIRPINNIVDFSNYYMYLTAQPTHAFDYDKVKKLCQSKDSPVIFPRLAKEGETLKLLNGKTIQLTSEDIVISTDQQAIGLAGVMGGCETEVDENTKNIVIESATFDMYTIRRTSMRHGLFTDAVTRYNKGQSAHQNDKVLAKLVNEITVSTNGHPGKLIDLCPAEGLSSKNQQPISLSLDFINNRLGSDLKIAEVIKILQNVEFLVTNTKNELTVTAPFWRMDIEIPEDIVEEVGRLYGYFNLAKKLPLKSINPAKHNGTLKFKEKIRNILSSAGANEVLTYSFVHENLIKSVGQNPSDTFHIRNAISPSLQYYRMSLLPSLIGNVHQNIKLGCSEFLIYEMNTVQNRQNGLDNDGVPIEHQHLAGVYALNDKNSKNKEGAAFYSGRKYLDYLAGKIGVDLEYREINNLEKTAITAPFNLNRSAAIYVKHSDTLVGFLGEFNKQVTKTFKLPNYCSGFELNIELLKIHQKQINYQPKPKYPVVEQDITLEVDPNTKYSTIETILISQISQDSNSYNISLKLLDIFSDEKTKRFTFRLSLFHENKTLVTDEVNRYIDQLVKNCSRTQSLRLI